MFWGDFAPAVLVSSKVAYNMYFELKQNLETEAPLGELSRRQKKNGPNLENLTSWV